MQGRKPKPVEQRRREGNPGKRKLPEVTLIGGREAPRMPSYLPSDAKVAWRQVVPALAEVGMLDAVDSAALEGLCLMVGTMRAASKGLAGGEMVVEGSQGQPVRNPLVDVLFKAQGEVRAWCERFGLDPSTRTRLGLQEQRKRSLGAEMAAQLGEPTLRAVK